MQRLYHIQRVVFYSSISHLPVLNISLCPFLSMFSEPWSGLN
ncbi:hypothetical protein LEMLEM_LOCUS10184 [Lemmus lemmus]